MASQNLPEEDMSDEEVEALNMLRDSLEQSIATIDARIQLRIETLKADWEVLKRDTIKCFDDLPKPLSLEDFLKLKHLHTQLALMEEELLAGLD